MPAVRRGTSSKNIRVNDEDQPPPSPRKAQAQKEERLTTASIKDYIALSSTKEHHPQARIDSLYKFASQLKVVTKVEELYPIRDLIKRFSYFLYYLSKSP